jgi:hypothetical protein
MAAKGKEVRMLKECSAAKVVGAGASIAIATPASRQLKKINESAGSISIC